MHFARSAVVTLTLAGVATLAGASAAVAQTGPTISVVPNPARPGDQVTITAHCGASATAATIMGGAMHLRMQPTAHAGVFQDLLHLSKDIPTGPQIAQVECNNGLHGAATWTIVSSATPSGAPKTGDGVTSTATGGPFAAVGIALLGAGGLIAGAAAIRRRRSGAAT